MKKILSFILLLMVSISYCQDRVITGTVVEQTSYWENGNIYTKNAVVTNNSTEYVITKGGIIGLQAEIVSDSPTLNINNTGKFEVTTNNFLVDFEKDLTVYSTNNILNISPTVISAGVGDVLTITGQSFGDRGKVGFANANAGGFIETDVADSQILTWTDTEITVLVPSIAGTGEVRVTRTDNTELFSDILTVDYSVLNIGYQGESYRTAHVDDNTQGGYTWQFSQDFPTEAREAFIQTLETWQCETDMNWIIGEDTPVNVRANDGINIVRFTQPNEVGSNNLGSCTSRYSGCVQSDGTIEWTVSELDIQFNVDKGWNYTGNPVTTQFDFGTVSLHELGHGRQLGHVVNKDAMMHYSLGNGDVKNELLSTDIEGSQDIQSYSTLKSYCGLGIFTDFDCSTLGIDNPELVNYFIYPNPTRDIINISKPYDRIVVYDLLGTVVSTDNNISYLSNGIYLVNIYVNNSSITKKLVIK